MNVETTTLIGTLLICSTGLPGILRIFTGTYMTQIATPMDDLLSEIDRTLQTKLYFLALSVVLALPDICVSLESADGRSKGDRYVAWCDNNLGNEFSFVTGADCTPCAVGCFTMA